MAKKVAISITLDGEILKDLDEELRRVQAEEIRQRRGLSTRSSLIERYVRSSLSQGQDG